MPYLCAPNQPKGTMTNRYETVFILNSRFV